PDAAPREIVLRTGDGEGGGKGPEAPGQRRAQQSLTSWHEREQEHRQNGDDGDEVPVERVRLDQKQSHQRQAANAGLVSRREGEAAALAAPPAGPARAETDEEKSRAEAERHETYRGQDADGEDVDGERADLDGGRTQGGAFQRF